MTRRDFLLMMSAAGVASASSEAPLTVPVHLVIDGQAKLGPNRLRKFWTHIWPEALREFAECGIRLECTQATGGVERPESCEPIVSGLDRAALNVVITNTIPMEWDRGLALGGVTTRYRGYHLCMVALGHASGNQIPLLSLNTCVHEMLHALMLDIFENRPTGLSGPLREFRIDWYATRLWLFRDGRAVRGSARIYLDRLSRNGSQAASSARLRG
jgi:hypothetical protein